MEQSSSSPRHFVIVGVLILVSTFVLNWLLSAALPLPVQASIQAVDIDWLFGLHVLLIAFLFSLVVVFMIYALIVFRRRDGDDGEGEHFEGNTKLEIAWTSAPMIFVIIFSVLGIVSLNKVTQAQDGEIPVKIVAEQWQFVFYYGDGEHPPMEKDGTPRAELVLAVDQPYIMQMRSKDVMHAFWVPAFRVKQDIMPGVEIASIPHGEPGEHGEEGDGSDDEAHGEEDDSHEEASHEEAGDHDTFEFPTSLRLTPSEIGKYKLRCAELCGGTHFSMRSDVYVVSPDAYERFAAGEDLQCVLKDTNHPDYDESEYDENKCG